eukprot:SAG31_NODE_11871_length_990_cov_1.148148_2_plen_67_part_01
MVVVHAKAREDGDPELMASFDHGSLPVLPAINPAANVLAAYHRSDRFVLLPAVSVAAERHNLARVVG